jgi:hypothetical protein
MLFLAASIFGVWFYSTLFLAASIFGVWFYSMLFKPKPPFLEASKSSSSSPLYIFNPNTHKSPKQTPGRMVADTCYGLLIAAVLIQMGWCLLYKPRNSVVLYNLCGVAILVCVYMGMLHTFYFCYFATGFSIGFTVVYATVPMLLHQTH